METVTIVVFVTFRLCILVVLCIPMLLLLHKSIIVCGADRKIELRGHSRLNGASKLSLYSLQLNYAVKPIS